MLAVCVLLTEYKPEVVRSLDDYNFSGMKMLRVVSWVLRSRHSKAALAVVCVVMVVCIVLVLYGLPATASKGLAVYQIHMDPSSRRRPGGSDPVHDPDPAADPFVRVQDLELFLYSAIVNDQEPAPGELNIIITAFDSTDTDSLTCCVVTDRTKKLYTVQAEVLFKFYQEDILGPFMELFTNAPTKAKQYACVMPPLGLQVSHVTLTTTVCPVAEDLYLPVVYPKIVPQGLAVCAKTAFGDQLEAEKLMEWLEVQRLLGVDHIQLMDLHTPPRIRSVLRYYSRLGLVHLLPYRLPGQPESRGLDMAHMVKGQFTHDETFSILDCTQRLRGYTYVISHDMDEVIVPRKHVTLKEFLREQFTKRPDAAGFFFYTEFFIYDWGPRNMDSNVTYFRYVTSTLPHDECKKYAYLSSRVFQGRTHTFTERSPYQKYYLPKEEAILHHYRKCPHVWSTCFPPRIVDESMLRFKGVLEERLEEARKAIGL